MIFNKNNGTPFPTNQPFPSNPPFPTNQGNPTFSMSSPMPTTPTTPVAPTVPTTMPHTTPSTIGLTSETQKLTFQAPKFITCFPVMTANGAKHTALNLAFTYKQKYPEHRVALIDLDFTHPTLLGLETSHDTVHGIDNLLDKIDSNHLTDELFAANLVKLRNGVFVLKGTKLKDNSNTIRREHLEVIFQNLRRGFDRVFINVSSLDDQSGTVYGLHLTDCVLFILNNNYTNYQLCEEKYQLVTRYYHGDNLFGVFNKFNNHSKVEFGDWIYSKKMTVLSEIPYDEKAIDGSDWFGSLLSKTKRQTKKQSTYDYILDQLI